MRKILNGHNLQDPSSMNTDPKDFLEFILLHLIFMMSNMQNNHKGNNKIQSH